MRTRLAVHCLLLVCLLSVGLSACSTTGTPSGRPTEVLHADGESRPAAQQPEPEPLPTPTPVVPAPLPDNVRIMPDDLPPLVPFRLLDQFNEPRLIDFPAARPVVLAVGDRDGSPQLDAWTLPLFERFGDRIDIIGIALVTGIEPVFRSFVRAVIKQQRPDSPVLLDWTGDVTKPLDCESGCANLYIVRPDGMVRMRALGAATPPALHAIIHEIRVLLGDDPAEE